MYFKFLDLVSRGKQQSVKTEAETYLSLLHRAAKLDGLDESEAVRLVDLHDSHGNGDLHEIASDIRDYDRLAAVAAKEGKLKAISEKSRAARAKSLAAHDDDVKAYIATKQAAREELGKPAQAAHADYQAPWDARLKRREIAVRRFALLEARGPSDND